MKTMDFVYLAGGALLGYFAYKMLTKEDEQSNFAGLNAKYGKFVRRPLCPCDEAGEDWASTCCNAYKGKGLL